MRFSTKQTQKKIKIEMPVSETKISMTMVVFDLLRSLIKRLLFRPTNIKVRMAEEEVEPERKQQQQQQHDGFKFLKSEDEAKFSNSHDDTSFSNVQYNESTPHGLPGR